MRNARRWIVGAVLVGALAAFASPRADAGPPGECPWDLDGSSLVGINDLLTLLSAWGTNPGGPPDFNGDLNVGISDLLEMLTVWGPCPGLGPCGTPGSGSCFAADGTPACQNFACCNTVCAIDPSCCDSAWNEACADLAAANCGNCGDPGAGDCCVADESVGCNDAACCATICAADAFCCEVEWDQFCVDDAVEACGICR